MVQRIKVKLPQDFRDKLIKEQTDRIEIFLRDTSGTPERKSVKKAFFVKDINFCPPPPVEEDSIGGASDSDLENAYQDCLDDIADLFCLPSTPVGAEDEAEPSIAEIISFNITTPEPYSSGGTVTLQWVITGSGRYEILSGRVDTSETESIREEDIIDSKLQDIEVQIPQGLLSETQIWYSLRIINPNLQPQEDGRESKYFREVNITITLTEEPPPGYLDLGFDNDVSDAKKELYTLAYANNLLDTTIIDWNNISANTGSIYPDDKLREHLGCFYIKNQSNDIISFARDLSTNQPVLPSVESSLVSQAGLINLKYNETLTSSVASFIKDLNYIDLTYEYQKPYTTKEASRVETPYNSLLLDIKTDYNYYLKDYEEVHVNLEESLLPNMYFIELNKEAQESREKDVVLIDRVNSITDYNLEVDPFINSILTLNAIPPDTREPVSIGSYYSFFLERFTNRTLEENQHLVNSSKTIFIPSSFYDKLESYNSKKEDYPFYNQISFSFSQEILQGRRDSDENIATTLKYRTPEFQTPFIMQCLFPFIDNNGDELQNLVKQEYDLAGNRLFASPNRSIKLNDSGNPYLYFDAFELDYIDRTGAKNPFLFLDNYLNLRRLNRAKIDDQKDIFGQILLLNYIKTRFRTYKNILEGKKAYRETLFYRIAKFKSSDLIGMQESQIASMTPLQNIVIPKDPDRNDFTYLDTQVKYGERYSYRIYSYDIVAGNEITETASGSSAQLKNRLGLYIVENLYDSLDCIVVDRPPLFPQVDFNFYKDIDNRVAISLNNNSIRAEAQPVLIKEEDSEIFSRIRQSQLLDQSEPISFGGDDIVKKYQVLRTTFPPRSYQDFDDGDLFEVSTRAGPESQIRYASIVHLDEIEPNKKYYYTFRCIDIHDQLSNPTEVYELEMINESGTIYPVLNVWQFPKTIGTEKSKKVKKLIMVQPQLFQQNLDLNIGEQTDINAIKDALLENIGNNIEEKIWDKTYKLRIVSKHTNKVYDIKFKFNKNGEIIT